MINYILLVRKNNHHSFISIIADNENSVESIIENNLQCEYQIIDRTPIDTFIIDNCLI